MGMPLEGCRELWISSEHFEMPFINNVSHNFAVRVYNTEGSNIGAKMPIWLKVHQWQVLKYILNM